MLPVTIIIVERCSNITIVINMVDTVIRCVEREREELINGEGAILL